MKVEDRLDAIERELAEIKSTLSSSRNLKVVKLKGIWKGLKVDDRDVEAAKKSLFKARSRIRQRWCPLDHGRRSLIWLDGRKLLQRMYEWKACAGLKNERRV